MEQELDLSPTGVRKTIIAAMMKVLSSKTAAHQQRIDAAKVLLDLKAILEEANK